MAAYGKCMRLLSRKQLFPAQRVIGIKTYSQSNSMTPTSATNTSSSLDTIGEISKARPFHEMPGPRGIYRMPYIGFLFHFKPFTNHTFKTMDLVFDKVIDQYGPVVRINLDVPAVLLSNADDIEKMFLYEGKLPFRPPFDIIDIYYKRTGKNEDLFIANGEKWQQLRSPVNRHIMRPNSMFQYLPAQNEVADEFVKMLARDGQHYNYPTDDGPFFWFAAESVAVVLFNARVGFLSENPDEDSKALVKATTDFFKYLGKSIGGSFLFNFYEDNTYKQFQSAFDFIEKETRRFIAVAKQDMKTRKENGTFDPNEPNLLFNLLNDKSLQDDEVLHIVKGMYAAGVDSTGCTLQSCFYLLATNPDKQDKLRKEIHKVMGRDNPLTREALSNMPYLKACLKESYRCMPPAPAGTIRKLPVDTVFAGYHVPAGVPFYTLNRKVIREEFDKPDEFIPERWLRGEDSKQNKSSGSAWAVLPFSFGPRGCPGKRIAEQEMYLAMSKTVQKLKIGLKPESRGTPFNYPLFIKPLRSLKLTFTEI